MRSNIVQQGNAMLLIKHRSYCGGPAATEVACHEEKEEDLVRLPGLMLRHSANIWVFNPDVRIQAIHIGVCVMTYNMLLLPHEGRCTNNVQCCPQQIFKRCVAGVGSMVCIMLNADAYLCHTDTKNHRTESRRLQTPTRMLWLASVETRED